MLTEGPLVERHLALSEPRANAGYMRVVSRSHIRLRVYERQRAKHWLAALAPAPLWWRHPAGLTTPGRDCDGGRAPDH